MSLLISMLPIYALGNLHCLGMCGPLVLMLGQHRHRYWYFLGRILSFSMAGWLAGEVGAVFHHVLAYYHIPAATCFLFGGIILAIGFYSLVGWQYPGYRWLAKRLSNTERQLSLLMLKDQAWTTFLFGFVTLLLPCGQTMLVFSACALSGDPIVGLVNGFAFSVLTSPSLWFAMRAHSFLRDMKRHYNTIMGTMALVVGALAILRGLAEVGVISHLVFCTHFVIY